MLVSIGIGLIFWKVKKTKVKEFPNSWQNKLKIMNRKGLVFEFLSKVEPTDDDMFTWQIYKEKGVNYINVGVWKSKRAFLREMQKIPKDVTEKTKEFKWGKTIRVWLTPEKIREGHFKIKREDAEFVD